MYKKRLMLILTVINHLIFLGVIGWLLREEAITEAYQEALQLRPLYYGSNPLTSVFDHDLPIPGDDDTDNNTYVRHYDNLTTHGYAYDQHEGIDYDLNYEPVLAAAEGQVAQAGWNYPDNHNRAYGLRVEIKHDDEYRTIYGHLSVIIVRKGQFLLSISPEYREGIIGISGNTGNSDGSHLHFTLKRYGRVVNPYGWNPPVGTATGTPGTPMPVPVDPWATWTSGTAVSVNVWEEYPAITGGQFSSGTAVLEPSPAIDARTIDNSDAEYSEYSPPTATPTPQPTATATATSLPSEPTSTPQPTPTPTPQPQPSCWQTHNGGGTGNAINGTFRYATIVEGKVECTATWRITPHVLTPAGIYDLFVHIPSFSGPETLSLAAEYTVHYDGGFKSTKVIVVQADYPNAEHGSWIYIGRYHFRMDNPPFRKRVSGYRRIAF